MFKFSKDHTTHNMWKKVDDHVKYVTILVRSFLGDSGIAGQNMSPNMERVVASSMFGSKLVLENELKINHK